MHFCVVKSRYIKIFALMLLVVTLLAVKIDGSSSAGVFFGYSTRLVPIYNVDTTEKKVAITFDAAWGADNTEEILEILGEYNATATFFLVGFWVDNYGELVEKIDASGCEIGTHSSTHPDMTKLSESEIEEELTLSVSKIEAITGKTVTLFRAPYGAYNNSVISVATSLSLKTIQWDVDTLDWKGYTASQILSRVQSKVKSGSIILMHNNSTHCLEALRLILMTLTNQGYQVTSVSNVIYESDYTVDRNGIQHSN